MSDLSGYRQQVTELGKKAVIAEQEKNYEQAYHNYHSALKVFMHLIKCKSNSYATEQSIYLDAIRT